jgi:hypothetical protein
LDLVPQLVGKQRHQRGPADCHRHSCAARVAASAAVAEEITPAPSLHDGAASGGRQLEASIHHSFKRQMLHSVCYCHVDGIHLLSHRISRCRTSLLTSCRVTPRRRTTGGRYEYADQVACADSSARLHVHHCQRRPCRDDTAAQCRVDSMSRRQQHAAGAGSHLSLMMSLLHHAIR